MLFWYNKEWHIDSTWDTLVSFVCVLVTLKWFVIVPVKNELRSAPIFMHLCWHTFSAWLNSMKNISCPFPTIDLFARKLTIFCLAMSYICQSDIFVFQAWYLYNTENHISWAVFLWYILHKGYGTQLLYNSTLFLLLSVAVCVTIIGFSYWVTEIILDLLHKTKAKPGSKVMVWWFLFSCSTTHLMV